MLTSGILKNERKIKNEFTLLTNILNRTYNIIKVLNRIYNRNMEIGCKSFVPIFLVAVGGPRYE